jgi:F-type H+-transporting ATPase subunit gamma
MPILKKIEQNIRTISYIESIARVYQEVAQMRMNQIREMVLRNREFIEELLKVYRVVRGFQFEKKRVEKKKRVLVFLSSTERFYGSLILDIWREVERYLKEKGGDLAIVGRMGKYLAEKSGLKLNFFYFDLDDEKPELEKVKEIVDFIKGYEEILVFYGKFKTVLDQRVEITNIGGREVEKEKIEKSYLFEPSPEEVSRFFEEELLFSFFNQVLWDHQLSRYATRMVSMYRAQENAKKLKEKMRMEMEKLKREIYNKKQIEQFAGYKLWS